MKSTNIRVRNCGASAWLVLPLIVCLSLGILLVSRWVYGMQSAPGLQNAESLVRQAEQDLVRAGEARKIARSNREMAAKQKTKAAEERDLAARSAKAEDKADHLSTANSADQGAEDRTGAAERQDAEALSIEKKADEALQQAARLAPPEEPCKSASATLAQVIGELETDQTQFLQDLAGKDFIDGSESGKVTIDFVDAIYFKPRSDVRTALFDLYKAPSAVAARQMTTEEMEAKCYSAVRRALALQWATDVRAHSRFLATLSGEIANEKKRLSNLWQPKWDAGHRAGQDTDEEKQVSASWHADLSAMVAKIVPQYRGLAAELAARRKKNGARLKWWFDFVVTPIRTEANITAYAEEARHFKNQIAEDLTDFGSNHLIFLFGSLNMDVGHSENSWWDNPPYPDLQLARNAPSLFKMDQYLKAPLEELTGELKVAGKASGAAKTEKP